MKPNRLAVCVFAAMFLTAIGSAYPRSLAPADIAELYEYADFVGFAVVSERVAHKVEDEVCGYRYLGSIEDALKGTIDAESAKFGRRDGLSVGNEYLLFLVRWESAEDFYNASGLRGHKELTPYVKNMIACGGLVPGFLYMEVLPVNERVVTVPDRIKALPGNRRKISKKEIVEFLSKNSLTPESRGDLTEEYKNLRSKVWRELRKPYEHCKRQIGKVYHRQAYEACMNLPVEEHHLDGCGHVATLETDKYTADEAVFSKCRNLKPSRKDLNDRLQQLTEE